jgi:2-pyrone-4,6-dicarboxylate lactonase
MLLPPNSCDTQVHVFGDLGSYPTRAGASYPPPEWATVDRMIAAQKAVGLNRAVLVQPSIYGSDHRLLLDCLSSLPRSDYVGVALLDGGVSDREIRTLHESGIRGVRFLLAESLGLIPTPEALLHVVNKVSEYGWVIKIYGLPNDWLTWRETLSKIRSPAVFDHMASLDFSEGLDQQCLQMVEQFLRERDNWWINLGYGDALSAGEYPWDDAVAFGQALYNVAPERCVWCSDWPRVMYPKSIPSDLQTLELLFRYLPDREAIKAVLVDNPARLFGFPRS